jgi:hypothetical protein
MGKIVISVDTKSARKTLLKIKKACSKAETARIAKQAADTWRTRMIYRTPKKWTGQTRRSWVVNRRGGSTYELTNAAKTMLYLELGTKAHGPRQATMLFIPLTRRAAAAGARGVINANRRAHTEVAFGARKAKAKPPFVYGKDYRWAKRVRGIRARYIVRTARPFAAASYRLMMVRHMRQALTP